MTTLPILCLDFDGCIHDYRHGWQDGTIYGELTPGFLDWACQAGKLFMLVVYSSRSKEAVGALAMADWIALKAYDEGWQTTDLPFNKPTLDNELPMLRMLHALRADVVCLYFAHTKPPAFLTIDDRAITFFGKWDDPVLRPNVLRLFKPWMAE